VTRSRCEAAADHKIYGGTSEIRGRSSAAAVIPRRMRRPRNVTAHGRRVLEAVLRTRTRLRGSFLKRSTSQNTTDSVLVTESRQCLHEPTGQRDQVVILKANGKGLCGGTSRAGVGPKTPTPTSEIPSQSLYKGTATCRWPTLTLGVPEADDLQIHGYCMGGGIYLGLLNELCVASEVRVSSRCR